MYKSIFYNYKERLIHLWDDETGYECFPYNRYAYVIDPDGEYETMTGLKVGKVNTWTKEQERAGFVFEHDVPVCTRTLIDRYYESDDPSTGHTIFIFDIEVKRGKKYSKPAESLNPITSISYYDSKSEKYVCLLLNEDGRMQSKEGLHVFRSEEGMLTYFIQEFRRIDPSIVTGWNSNGFDLPYLYNRIKRILSEREVKKLSPIGIVFVDTYKGNYEVRIAGVNCMDYLTLYKKFTYNEEPSYTLDAIATKELGRGKVKYEGSLDQLYETDPIRFVDYNIEDVRLIVDIDKKLDFIEIARGICHKGHVPYEDFPYSSKYLDGACLTYGKRNGIVLIGKSAKGTNDNTDDAEGAFVKLPNPGLYRYVYDLDLESEYPNNIITLNISPETKWGRIKNWDPIDLAKDTVKDYKIERIASLIDEFDFESKHHEVAKLREFLDKYGLTISAAGILYRTNKVGMVPAILKTWAAERKSYRKIASDHYNGGQLEQYRYFNRKQLVTKILLNSLYGVLLLRTFRFYDRENGESVTKTGQHLIQFSADMGNICYHRQIGSDQHIKDFCIYQDTDSAFFEALPIIEHRYGSNQKSDQFLIEKTLEIASEIEQFINKSYDLYALKFYNAKSHTWRIKQEMVGKTAFWRNKKKRYAMKIVNKDGLNVDDYDIKGFDSVRADFPQAYRKFVKQSIIDILEDSGPDILNKKVRDVRSYNSEVDFRQILLPVSIKDMSKYNNKVKNVPIHYKAGKNFNELLKLCNLEAYPTIEDGDKIKWAYLRQNPFNFDVLAINGYDDPPEIIEYIEKYIDRSAHFNKRLLTKLQPIWDNLGWGKIQLEEESQYF